MKLYLYNYIKEIDSVLKNNKKMAEPIINNRLIKIHFFQYERIIHLLVTLFYALLFLLFLLFFSLGFIHYIFFILQLYC